LEYEQLVGTLHYDEDERSVYQTTRVVEEGDYIVVYRKRRLMNGNYKREERRPLFAKDVEAMTKLYSAAEEGGKKK
jgi:hypothetical protein